MIIVKGKLAEILYHACLIDGKLDSVIAADNATILLSPKELAEQMTAGNFKEFIKHIHKIPLPQPQKQTFTDSDFLPEKPQQERMYPCKMCGKLLTKDEGGNIFTVCDECWEKTHKPQQEFCEHEWDFCGTGGTSTSINNDYICKKCGIVKKEILPILPEPKFNPQSIEAVIWAKAFTHITHHIIDEETMIGWFANAIMAGFDEANRRKEKGELMSEEEILKIIVSSELFDHAMKDPNLKVGHIIGADKLAYALLGKIRKLDKKGELREEIAKIISLDRHGEERSKCRSCLEIVDKLLSILSKPELASEEKILVLMLNKIPAKYYNNPDKIKEFGDMFEEIAHALVGKVGKIEPKPYKINDQIVSKEVFEKFAKEYGFEPKKEIEVCEHEWGVEQVSDKTTSMLIQKKWRCSKCLIIQYTVERDDTRDTF